MYAHQPSQHEMAQLQMHHMQQRMNQMQGGAPFKPEHIQPNSQFIAGFGGSAPGFAPQQSQPPPQHQTNMTPPAGKNSKKRKVDGASPAQGRCEEPNHDGDGDEDGRGKASGFLRLPDVIDKLANSGEVLKYDASSQLYCVLDGPGFEKKFNELRYTRGKKNDGATNRPFSRMHAYFVLVRGEKWAGTGSAFKAKEVAQVVSSADMVSASNINITLLPSDDSASFQVTLQHFLNVTGAGDLYKFAKGNAVKQEPDADHVPSDGMSTNSNSRAPSVPASSEGPGSPASAEDFFDNCESDTLLDANDVGNLLESIWHENSKGDQAYFFRRANGLRPFANGAICTLTDGVLTADAKPTPGAMYMVVSDNNAKWKGEPIPTPEEEYYGHWCCFLGQLPVVVEGPVQCGDYIGPKGDGTGVGKVAHLGKEPVVGIALNSKSASKSGIVKTMVFAGLNAMTRGGDQFTEIFEQARHTQAMVEDVKRDVEQVEKSVEQIKGRSGMTETNVLNLAARLHMVERSLFNPWTHQHPQASVPANDGEWRMLAPGQPLDHTWSQQSSRWLRRRKGKIAAIMVCCLVVGAIGATVRARRIRHSEAKMASSNGLVDEASKDRYPFRQPNDSYPGPPPAQGEIAPDKENGNRRSMVSNRIADSQHVLHRSLLWERKLHGETEGLIRLQAKSRDTLLSR